MTDSDREFFGHECSVWRHNGGADDAVFAVGGDFDETVWEMFDLAGKRIFQINDSVFVLFCLLSEIGLILTDGSDLWVSIGDANEASIAWDALCATGEVLRENDGLVFGALGG